MYFTISFREEFGKKLKNMLKIELFSTNTSSKKMDMLDFIGIGFNSMFNIMFTSKYIILYMYIYVYK
jgi:hypothetical protein